MGNTLIAVSALVVLFALVYFISFGRSGKKKEINEAYFKKTDLNDGATRRKLLALAALLLITFVGGYFFLKDISPKIKDLSGIEKKASLIDSIAKQSLSESQKYEAEINYINSNEQIKNRLSAQSKEYLIDSLITLKKQLEQKNLDARELLARLDNALAAHDDKMIKSWLSSATGFLDADKAYTKAHPQMVQNLLAEQALTQNDDSMKLMRSRLSALNAAYFAVLANSRQKDVEIASLQAQIESLAANQAGAKGLSDKYEQRIDSLENAIVLQAENNLASLHEKEKQIADLSSKNDVFFRISEPQFYAKDCSPKIFGKATKVYNLPCLEKNGLEFKFILNTNDSVHTKGCLIKIKLIYPSTNPNDNNSRDVWINWVNVDMQTTVRVDHNTNSGIQYNPGLYILQVYTVAGGNEEKIYDDKLYIKRVLELPHK